MSSNQKTSRLATLILSICMLFSAFASPIGAAAASDTKGHWAEAPLNDWMQKGLLKGYDDGAVKPDEPITRAELMALVNRAFSFTKKADIRFKDLKASDWEYADVQLAVQAAYIQGYDDQTIRSGNQVTRQEAASIVSRLQKLEGNAEAADSLADSASFPIWSKDAIGAIVKSGIMRGYEDNRFRAERPITRAEAIVTLQRVIGVVYDTAGTYGPESGNEIMEGNVTIAAPGVTLRNMEITGSLRIAASVGDGDAHLKHVTVRGKTLVNGGGEHSIVIDLSSLITGVFVERTQDEPVRIVLIGSTASQIDVQTPVIIQQGDVPGMPTHVQTVNINTPTKIFIQGGQIQYVNVGPNAGGSTVSLGGGANVSEMNVGSPVNVVGNGTIDKAILFTSPDGILFEIQPGSTFIAPPTPTITMAKETGFREALISVTSPQDEFFITGYTVTSYPGGITADGQSNQIKVKGLKAGEHYTFTVKAKNIAGMTSAASNSSNVVKMSGSSPVSATTNEDGTIVSVRFNKPIKEPKNVLGQLAVAADYLPNVVSAVTLKDASTIDLTLKYPVKPGQTVKVAYAPVSTMGMGLLLTADNWYIEPFELPVKVTIPQPKFVSATTDAAGSIVTVTFDKPMADPTGSHVSFKVNVNGKPVLVSAAALNAAQYKIDLTLGTPVKKGQSVTVAYTAGSVTSADTGQLASFAAYKVTNAVMVESPEFVSAETNETGTIITVTFDKPMANPAGMHSNFSVKADGQPNFLKAAALNGTNKIDLTLATPVRGGQSVTVSYVYTIGKVAAADKGLLASFAEHPVMNKVTATPPAFVSATTNAAGSIVTVTFDKAMADPAGKQGQFTVNVNGVPHSVTTASLNSASTRIDLTLATPVTYGQSVTIAYAAGNVTASDTGVLATFAPQNVTNTVPAPPSPPIAPSFVSATTNATGTIVTVSFNKAMADPTGTHGQFAVNVGGGFNPVTAAALNGTNKIDLTLTTPVTSGQTVTVAYTAGTVTAANTMALASFAPQTVTNAVLAAPAFVSATTNAAGTIVTVTFNKAMADPTGTQGQFMVNVNGAPNPVTAAALRGTNKIDLTLTTPVTNGQAVDVMYTAGTVTAADTGVLATFAAPKPVSNAVGSTAPNFVSATTNATGTIVTVTFDKPMADPAGKENYFSVFANNNFFSPVPLSAATLNSTTTKIDLRLATPLTSGQTVHVAFLQYSPGEWTAADGGVLASFAPQTVTNAVATAPDTTPPTLSLAIRNSVTQITVILSEDAATATVTKSNAGGFVVSQTGSPGVTYAVTGIAPGGTPDQVVLTVSNMSASSATGVTVTYTAGGNGTITDAAGNPLATNTTGVIVGPW
ncbi:SwmB domain-containing protein [Cohnella nanjingensis]|uniref:S-layer homology domain-containing protein n=1 Tax=Cohnella nanjingensis TaxID=1387779 RepID=A0A7X0RU74_9BACL|nr:SwmB domain-containing protein [Cohnella nanjingensis]MBB6673782.1 S-layer homology domain-containing protein [Cohnella nanjingensis]